MKEAVVDVVLAVLHKVAPEADLSRLDREKGIREQIDFDSVDFLNFINGLQEAFQVQIPELDYPQCCTLKGCCGYLSARMPS